MRRRYKIALSALVVAACSAVPGPGVVRAVSSNYAEADEAALTERGREHYAWIRGWLRAPFEGFEPWEVLARPFAVVTLSQMAAGLVNVATLEPERRDEAGELLEEVLRRALLDETTPFSGNFAPPYDVRGYGLYASHLNVIVGAHRLVTGSDRHAVLHRRLSEQLRALSLADGDFHVASFPSPALKWPADQTVTLLSLWLYDQARGTRLSARPITGWLDIMAERHTDSATGLHHASVSKSLWYAEIPRGCALSWSTMWMAQFAPEAAAELYQRYRAQFRVDVMGAGGFREWPPGRDLPSDIDSGPIVMGVGVAATGLGLGPARLHGDGDTVRSILRAADLTGAPTVLTKRLRYLTAPLLGEAILFAGETATRWQSRTKPVPTRTGR